jgi:hypothetical protein
VAAGVENQVSARPAPSELRAWASVHRRRRQRHERDDVDGPDARVLTGVLIHVDLVDRRDDQPLEGVADGAVLAGQREDGSVVAGVARPVEEEDAAPIRSPRPAATSRRRPSDTFGTD